MSEEESGFTFVDKRRNADDADSATSSPEPNAAETAIPDPPTTEAEQNVTPSADHPGLTMQVRLLMCIDILQQGAWIALGLIADPTTGEIQAELEQAKMAIDGVKFLAEKVERQLDDTTRRDLKNLVNDLQVNFVQQMSRQ